MKKYQFTRNLVCAGVPRSAGEVLPEDKIPDGSLVPLLRTGMIVEYSEPVAEPEPDVSKKSKPKAEKE